MVAVRIAAVLVFLLAASAARAEGFVGGTDDVPLMDGLTEVEGAGTVFDNASGRIVEAFASGDMDAATVARFYEDTLPQLGWRAEGDGGFTREGEHLAIVTVEGERLTVRFTLTPE
jgi:hypothetical protein